MHRMLNFNHLREGDGTRKGFHHEITICISGVSSRPEPIIA